MKVSFYIGDVNSRGGSKVSLLNNILFLNEKEKPFEVYANGEGWFTSELDTVGIPYTLIDEPYLISKVNRNTSFILIPLIVLACSFKLISNWRKVNKKIGKSTIVFNEPRDMLFFFPFLFGKKNKRIQWIRAEMPGKLSKVLMRYMDLLVAVSDNVLKNVRKVSDRPSIRIYNFMNRTTEVKSKSYNISDKHIVNLGVVGSIQPIKGQLDAVKTLKKLIDKDYNVKLFIVGKIANTEYNNIINNYIIDNNLKEYVTFTGQLNNVTEFMEEVLDLVLTPSQTESFCRVAMEALSVGKPVVAYSVGGIPEVVNNFETGFLVERNDIKQMSEKVMNLINNPDEYERLSFNAAKYWEENFSKKAVEADLLDAFYGG